VNAIAMRRALGLILSALIAALIVAPAPGAVGSCSGDDLDEPADLVSYCTERETLVCVRELMRGERDGYSTNQCRVDGAQRCSRRFWGPSCRPTKREANACLNALRAVDTLETQEKNIAECDRDALCTARPTTTTGGMVDAGEEAP
jgi:hypothetical protein